MRCPDCGGKKYRRNKRRLKRRNPEETWDVSPRTTWALYIGKVINPKSNQIFKVFWDRPRHRLHTQGEVLITKDEPGRVGPGSRLNKYVVGMGELDFNDLASVIEEGYSCVRTHSDEGVVEVGKGYGSALYAGLCLTAASLYFLFKKGLGGEPGRKYDYFKLPYEPCIYSIDSDDRSNSADKWWDRQSEEGLATRYDHCVGDEYSGDLPMTEEKIRKLDSRGFMPCFTHGMNYDPNCPEAGCRYLSYIQSRNISLLSNTEYKVCSKDTLQVIHIENLVRHGRIAKAPYLSPRLQEMVNAYGGKKYRRNPKCVCGKLGRYSLSGVEHLCKEHFLLIWQRVKPGEAPIDVTKARSTRTTVFLYRGPVYDSDPLLPWEVVCDDHAGIICAATRAEAKSLMSVPEEWCPDCQEYRGKKRRRNPDIHLQELERQYAGGDNAVIAPLFRAYLRQGRAPDLDADGLALLRRHGGDGLFLDYLTARVAYEPTNRSRWRSLLLAAEQAGLLVLVPGYPLRDYQVFHFDLYSSQELHVLAEQGRLEGLGQPAAMAVSFIPQPGSDVVASVFGHLVARSWVRLTPSEERAAPLGIYHKHGAELYPVPWESIPHNEALRVDYQVGAGAEVQRAARSIILRRRRSWHVGPIPKGTFEF